MDEIKVENANVYGLENSIRVSRFPMAVDVDTCSSEITKNTISLGQSPAGSGHDNFLNGIVVQFDLTCSNKMWVEMERYHFIDFVSSQSTMHRITKLDIKSQCNEWVWPTTIDKLNLKVAMYNACPSTDLYLEILYNVPSGFQLTAGMTTNYRQLKTIYYQRRNHRLPEWREFCTWIETLPNFRELCLKEE